MSVCPDCGKPMLAEWPHRHAPATPPPLNPALVGTEIRDDRAAFKLRELHRAHWCATCEAEAVARYKAEHPHGDVTVESLAAALRYRYEGHLGDLDSHTWDQIAAEALAALPKVEP